MRVAVYLAEQHKGDIVFIPHGAPHSAMNEEDTVMLAYNYLDPPQLEMYKEALGM